MKVYYHPDTDSVAIHLKDGAEGVVGEVMGEASTTMSSSIATRGDAVRDRGRGQRERGLRSPTPRSRRLAGRHILPSPAGEQGRLMHNGTTSLRRLSDFTNNAYILTPVQVDLL